VIADLNEENAKRQAQAIRDLGRKALACQADVTRKADIQRVLEATLANFGGVEILLNAAGINSGTPFFEIEEAEWQRILDVDLRSVFLACQVFGKAMVDSGKGGSIINISSASSDPRYPRCSPIRWRRARQSDHQVSGARICSVPGAGECYSARFLSRGAKPQAAHRRARGIHHEPHAHAPLRAPSELIGAAVYLASDKASSFVTGSIVRVDGGFGAMTI